VPEVKKFDGAFDSERLANSCDVEESADGSNRRKFDPTALKTPSSLTNEVVEVATDTTEESKRNAQMRRKDGHVQAPTADVVKRGGLSLAPALVTRNRPATTRMAAARKHGDDPDLIVPDDPVECARYEAAFARFADIFPDAFYITERARVYLNAEKEQKRRPLAERRPSQHDRLLSR